MKRWLLAAACGAVALGLLLYPLMGELLNEKYHSDVETTYTAAIEDTDDAELIAQRQAAQQYMTVPRIWRSSATTFWQCPEACGHG